MGFMRTYHHTVRSKEIFLTIRKICKVDIGESSTNVHEAFDEALKAKFLGMSQRQLQDLGAHTLVQISAVTARNTLKNEGVMELKVLVDSQSNSTKELFRSRVLPLRCVEFDKPQPIEGIQHLHEADLDRDDQLRKRILCESNLFKGGAGVLSDELFEEFNLSKFPEGERGKVSKRLASSNPDSLNISDTPLNESHPVFGCEQGAFWSIQRDSIANQLLEDNFWMFHLKHGKDSTFFLKKERMFSSSSQKRTTIIAKSSVKDDILQQLNQRLREQLSTTAISHLDDMKTLRIETEGTHGSGTFVPTTIEVAITFMVFADSLANIHPKDQDPAQPGNPDGDSNNEPSTSGSSQRKKSWFFRSS